MSEEYLRRSCFLALFAYIYGEPLDSSRYTKISLIQFTNAVLPIDFDTSIGEQMRNFMLQQSSNPLYRMNDYYKSLFSLDPDPFYDTMFLEYNIQNKLGGECYIFRRGADKYVIFRGSDSLTDIWVDVTIETTPLVVGNVLTDANIRVHKGFLDQMKNYNFIRQIVKAVGTGEHIFIIGHSLGAASAMLQGYYLHSMMKNTNTSISIVTVGGPVVGTSSWLTAFNDVFCSGNPKRTFDRLINERDIVPNLHTLALDALEIVPLVKLISSKLDPPSSAYNYDYRLPKYLNKYTFEYDHAGYETWIIYQNDGRPILKRVTNAKHVFPEPTLLDVASIADNHMIEYQKWLSNANPPT